MILGIDIGGSKTLIAPFTAAGELLGTQRFPTPKSQEEFISDVIRLIDTYRFKEQLEAIVVGVPAIVRENVPAVPPNLPWPSFDIAEILEHEYHVPVWCENDANLAGLSEVRRRSPIPSTALYLTISTDIGSGIITDGKIDAHFATSEAGHMMLEYDGKLRKWGSFASGGALYKLHGRYAADITSKTIWDHHAVKIAYGLLALLPTLQPSLVVLGGSLGTFFERYQDTLERYLDAHLPPVVTRPHIEQALNPEEAVAYGCYFFAHDHLTTEAN